MLKLGSSCDDAVVTTQLLKVSGLNPVPSIKVAHRKQCGQIGLFLTDLGDKCWTFLKSTIFSMKCFGYF